MYNLILIDLKLAKDVKDLYERLRFWKRLYKLSINQCQHILIVVKEVRPEFSTI